MSSSISSSESAAAWRRFFLRTAAMAAGVVGVIYLFVTLVDPWGSLPVSLPLDRVPVTSNQRFSYPALARSPRFDSAIFGTSTSRLLRPAALDPAFGARFANLAMNSATPFETSSLLHVFIQSHPSANTVMLGVDSTWCVTGTHLEKFTPRQFPAWMYQANRWRGYAEMLNLFAIQEAGKEFAVLTGLKKPDMGRDGYTSFVPPDATYDRVRAAGHLRDAGPTIPAGERTGPPVTWVFPALDMLTADIASLPAGTRKVLYFAPYYHRLFSAPGSDGAAVWDECKRRVGEIARTSPNATAVDFMVPSLITETDDNYWDPLHYRVAIADRVARDLTEAARGEASPDYRLLARRQ